MEHFVHGNHYSQSHNNNMNSPNMALPSRLPRPKPASEEWKRSSTSASASEWKTTSNKPKKELESWKMSGKPRHAQLANVEDRTRRQSAPLFNSPSWQNPKPLPIEPVYAHLEEQPHYTTHQSTPAHPPFHVAVTPIQPPAFICPPQQQQPEFYPQQQQQQQNYHPPFMHAPPPQQQQPEFYPQYNQPPMNYPPQQQPMYQEYPPQQHPYPYNEHTMMHQPLDHPQIETTTTAVSLQDPPVPKTPEKTTPKKKDATPSNAKPEKKVRQITVQSINAEHRVWIDVLPAETGLSLAEKIHIIATFRTRKIVSITTASGRKVPLDNRPVFGSWMDMESFEDGERWEVEWRENDRGVVDRFMSKIVQAGGGKRSKDLVAKD